MEYRWKVESFLGCFCHSIWSWRNKENHDHFVRLNEPAVFDANLVRDYGNTELVANKVIRPYKVVRLITWKPPSTRWEDGRACCGGIWDSNGE